jgi:uncharacterized protein DUF6644
LLLEFCQYIQSTWWATGIRQSWYVYPVIMSLHLTGIAMFGGAILMTDLRLLGIALKKTPITEVVNQLRPLKWFGILLVATCGILMLTAKAEEYYYNIFVWIKLSLLALVVVHGFVFRRSVYRNPELDRSPRLPARAKLAASLSLILWSSIACAGRGIGYIETPVAKIHAELQLPGAGSVAGTLTGSDRGNLQ